MSAKAFPAHRGRFSRWLAGAVILAAACSVHSASAQTTAPEPAIPNKISVGPQDAGPAAAKPAAPDGGVVQAGCATCGGGLPPPGVITGSCGAGCYPGRTCTPCCCSSDTRVGHFLCGLYDCICCPDPCYEPHWIPLADAAFFVDAARPQTQMRLRWDSAWNLKHPDRAEYFWAREKVRQLEPNQPGSRHGGGRGPGFIAKHVDYEDLSLYMEGATGGFGAFVETPYREVDPETALISPKPALEKSGFADLTVGTKSLLLDCELLQIAFEFKTFIPTGDFGGGLGTGHVSLEPSLLFGLRLGPDSYLQGQFSYWIPIGGDQLYQGNIFHTHISYNRVLWRFLPDVLLVGTVESNEWSILGGNYTSPDILIGGRPVPISATTSIFSMGPGIRLFICDKIDLGVGSAFALTGDRWAEELVRAEFRWRF